MIAAITAAGLLWGLGAPTAGAQSWHVSAVDQRCITVETFEGPGETELALSIEIDGSARLLLANSGWSTQEDRHYPDLTVHVNGQTWEGAGGYGGRLASKPAFVMNMPAEFLDDFAGGRTLRVTRGDTLVDQLSLTGSADAVERLRACIGPVRRAHGAAQRERDRLAHIPADPFAD